MLSYSSKFDRPLRSGTDGSGICKSTVQILTNAGSAISHNVPVSENLAESLAQTLGTWEGDKTRERKHEFVHEYNY